MPQIITTRIERLSYDGGRGVGRVDGLVVFIPNTAPGDFVEALVTKSQKNFLEAQLIKVLEPGTHRRQPPCPVVLECGGCPWQHVNYDEQLNQKTHFLRRSMRKWIDSMGGIEVCVVPSENEFRYRNRIQLHVKSPKGQPEIGYFKKGTHDLVKIDDCLLVPDDFVRRGKTWVTADGAEDTRKIEIKEGSVKDISNSFPEFSQVNDDINMKLTQFILQSFEGCDGNTPRFIYDFFSGDGNFTFPIAQKFASSKIFAIESSNDAVTRGNQKKLNQVANNIDFINQACDEYLENSLIAKESFILADPPRSGLSKFFIAQILKSKPKLFIYVSCNLGTLERDLEQLTKSNDMTIVAARGFDMFPQTEYVESVVVLKRQP